MWQEYFFRFFIFELSQKLAVFLKKNVHIFLRVIQILTSPENQEDFDQNKRTIENQEEHSKPGLWEAMVGIFSQRHNCPISWKKHRTQNSIFHKL